MPFFIPVTASPFLEFKNSTLVFEVEDDDNPDSVDAAGNPFPALKDVTIECYLKPVKINPSGGSNISLTKKYPGIDTQGIYVEGYVVLGSLDGIGIEHATKSAIYRGQSGVFVRLVDLQSPVTADHVTGKSIRGIFQIRGGGG